MWLGRDDLGWAINRISQIVKYGSEDRPDSHPALQGGCLGHRSHVAPAARLPSTPPSPPSSATQPTAASRLGKFVVALLRSSGGDALVS